MGIVTFFIIACLIGFLVYLIQTYAPIPPVFKTIVLWAGVIVVVVMLLSALGILPAGDVAIPKLR